MWICTPPPGWGAAAEPGGGVQIHIFWGMGGVGILGYGAREVIPAILRYGGGWGAYYKNPGFHIIILARAYNAGFCLKD